MTHPVVRSVSIVPVYEAGSPGLHLFQVVNVPGLMRVPNCGGVFEHRSHYC